MLSKEQDSEIWKKYQNLAQKHLRAMIDEAIQMMKPYDMTEAGAAMGAMQTMNIASCWSMGASLAANGKDKDPILHNALKEMYDAFVDGHENTEPVEDKG